MALFIKNFNQLGKNDTQIAGGKGASLGEMTQAGIPVPPGFVVLSDSFESFIKTTGLEVEIDAALETVNNEEMYTVEHASEKIKALILNAELPAGLQNEIRQAYEQLNKLENPKRSSETPPLLQKGDQGGFFVAVRSSATAEDSASAAWAGQLDSFLNTTSENLLENIKKCWASLFTPRAIFYGFEKGFYIQKKSKSANAPSPLRRGQAIGSEAQARRGGVSSKDKSFNQKKTKISVAVVVQKMIQSKVSGIAFSVHPVTEDYNQLIIEASYGLGEAIVSGQVTPDSYVVEKNEKNIIEKMVQEKTRGLFKNPKGGSEWRNIKAVQIEKQALTDKKILELSDLIMKIENHYGFPVDIEWALEGDKFYIVQSRPITTLTKRIETSKKFRKEDYLLAFWVQGVSVFVTDIHSEIYRDLETLFIIDQGMFKQYFSNKAFKRALDRGVKFYGDKIAFDIYETDLRKLCEDFKLFFEQNIKNKNKISRENVLKFFEFTKKLCGDYTKMNFEFTDKAFIEQDNNPIIKNNLAKASKFKDFVRKEMNIALFEPEGYSYKLFNILSKQFDLDISVIENLTQNEILSLFSGILPDEKIVKKRQNAFAEGFGLNSLLEGENVLDIILEFREENTHDDKISGQIANKGFYKGCVKIIPVDYGDMDRINKEIGKMKKGEVLVTETTAPEVIVACKKAGAIVTDMGGLMSHAAIVSREFGIPCIVGTKNASKILRDGDLIEVDASEGKVTILKRANENYENIKIPDSYKDAAKPRSERSSGSGANNGTVKILKKSGDLQNNTKGASTQPPKIDIKHATHSEKHADTSLSEYPYGIDWFFLIERPQPFFLTVCFIKAWGPLAKQITGFGSRHQLYLLDEKTMYVFRSKKEWDKLNKYFYNLLQNEPEKINQWISDGEAYIRWIDDLLKNFNPLGDKKYLIKQYPYIIERFTTHLLLNALISRWVLSSLESQFANKDDLDEYKSFIDNFEKIRNRTQFIEFMDKIISVYFDLAAQKTGHRELMSYTTPEELYKILYGENIDFSKIKNRKNCAFWTNEKKEIEFSFNNELFDKFRPVISSIDEIIKGEIACKGKARGKVKIVNIPAEINKINKGDILVSINTNPALMPAIRKATAIVTDEGGMACHAAIVSREQNIPCIVGTKNATRALRDGDLVEVDASEGIVKILKKAKNNKQNYKM